MCYVCVHLGCTHVLAACTHSTACGGQKRLSHVFFNCSPSYFLRQGLSPNLINSARLAGQWVPRVCHAQSSANHPHHPLAQLFTFYTNAADPNLGPHACAISPLSMEPFLHLPPERGLFEYLPSSYQDFIGHVTRDSGSTRYLEAHKLMSSEECWDVCPVSENHAENLCPA